jgi:hypothetical protein
VRRFRRDSEKIDPFSEEPEETVKRFRENSDIRTFTVSEDIHPFTASEEIHPFRGDSEIQRLTHSEDILTFRGGSEETLGRFRRVSEKTLRRL